LPAFLGWPGNPVDAMDRERYLHRKKPQENQLVVGGLGRVWWQV